MREKFRINAHLANNNTHLALKGPFDGNSAFRLIDTILSKDRGNGEIIIETGHIGEILPFGKRVFENMLGIKGISRKRIVFTGEKCREMGLKGCRLVFTGKQKICRCDGKCANCPCKRAVNDHGLN